MKHIMFLDILSINPQIFFSSQKRQRTLLGTILSVISYIIMISISGIFVSDLLNKDSMNIISSQVFPELLKLNLTSLPLMLT
jgi:hypothetical protein